MKSFAVTITILLSALTLAGEGTHPLDLVAKFSAKNKLSTEKQFQQVNQLIGELPQDEREFYIQEIILKTVLRNKPSKYTASSLKLSKESAQKLSAISPFSRWLISNILVDYNELLNSRLFREYNLQKRSIEGITSPQLLAFSRKLSLILPWTEAIKRESVEEFKDRLSMLAIKILKNLETQLKVINSILDSPTPITSETEYLSLSYFKTIPDAIEKLKISEKELINLPEPTDDWVPNEKDELFLNIFNYNDPEYTPPTELPSPTGDWLPFDN